MLTWATSTPLMSRAVFQDGHASESSASPTGPQPSQTLRECSYSTSQWCSLDSAVGRSRESIVVDAAAFGGKYIHFQVPVVQAGLCA